MVIVWERREWMLLVYCFASEVLAERASHAKMIEDKMVVRGEELVADG